MENKISAVIITYNEERNIARCLVSLQQVADEIIVVDSGSTDNTAQICGQHGATVVHQPWLGYGAQKNMAAQLAHFDYILSLDADEALSPELILSLKNTKQGPMADAYEVSRLTNYCGKWIYHCGWYPDRKIRLWRRYKASWTTPRVHETIQLSPNTLVERLQGNLLHYTYYTLAEHIHVANHYTTLLAEEYVRQGKSAGLLKRFGSPLYGFFRDYILRLGILDGYYGFIICLIAAFSTFLKYAKLKQFLQRDNL